MVKCLGCGEELNSEAYFCSKCGLRTEKGEKDGVKTPMDNRAVWERDVETALNNAIKLMEEAFNTARNGLRNIANEIGVEIERAKTFKTTRPAPTFCPKCGSKNPSDAEYCTNCGKEIQR